MTTAASDRSNDIAGHAVQTQGFLGHAYEYLDASDLEYIEDLLQLLTPLAS